VHRIATNLCGKCVQYAPPLFVAVHCRHCNPGYTSKLKVKLSLCLSKHIMKMCTRVYPKVSGLAVLRENSSLQLGAVVLLFCESV